MLSGARSHTDIIAKAQNRPVRSVFKIQFCGGRNQGTETCTGPIATGLSDTKAPPLAFSSHYLSAVGDSYVWSRIQNLQNRLARLKTQRIIDVAV